MTAPLVYIVGCGRSGTTLLGRLLGRHRDVLFLNEPRNLWRRVYLRTDIWSPLSLLARGRLQIDAAAASKARCNRYRRLLENAASRAAKSHIVEKTPINVFRLPFLHALTPDSRVIFLVRHPCAVASSISKLADAGRWYGSADRKWRALASHAESRESTRGLAATCATNFDRGLLEWRLADEAHDENRGLWEAQTHMEVQYEDLCARPHEVVGELCTWLQLPTPAGEMERITDDVADARKPSSITALTPTQRALIGDQLAEYWQAKE